MIETEPITPPIRAAIKASMVSSERFKLGASIADKNKVLAVGYNRGKTHTKFSSGNFCTIHAEGDAIRRALAKGVSLKGKTLVVYRKNSRLSKPCSDCEALAKEYGIKKIIYSANPNTFETLIIK